MDEGWCRSSRDEGVAAPVVLVPVPPCALVKDRCATVQRASQNIAVDNWS